MKVRVLVQRAISRAIQDSVSALNVRAEVMQNSFGQEDAILGFRK